MNAIKKLIDSYNGICALSMLTYGTGPDKLDFEKIKNDKIKIAQAIDEYERMLDLKDITSSRSVSPVFRNMVADARVELDQLNK